MFVWANRELKRWQQRLRTLPTMIPHPSHLPQTSTRNRCGKKGAPCFPTVSPDRMNLFCYDQFNILHHLGNLSPWRTVNFGLKGTAQVPEGCTVQQVQLLHRYGLAFVRVPRLETDCDTCFFHSHGARYPTTGTGVSRFAEEVVGANGFKA